MYVNYINKKYLFKVTEFMKYKLAKNPRNKVNITKLKCSNQNGPPRVCVNYSSVFLNAVSLIVGLRLYN